MANKQNLIPIDQVNSRRSREKHQTDSRKGGKKSGEVRRKRKAMKEQMEMLLTLPFKQKQQLKFIKNLGIETESIDNQMALIVAMYEKALEGNVQAFHTIREITQDDKSTNNGNRIEIINDLPEESKDEN